MILNIISFLTGRKIIWLRDFSGECYRTIEIKSKKRNPFPAVKACYVFPFTKFCHVRLLPDGKVEGSSYIEEWKLEGGYDEGD